MCCSRHAATETKDVETAPVKSDSTSGFIKKFFGKIERMSKNKSSPVKEAPKETPASEAPVEPVPVPEAEPAVESAPVVEETPSAEETPVVDAPAPATTESKPPTAESKISDKITEGKGYFLTKVNKVKKTFFTKSHSFSGSIPDSKQSVAPTSAPPAVIDEVPTEAKTAEVSAPVTEVRRCLGVE